MTVAVEAICAVSQLQSSDCRQTNYGCQAEAVL